MATHSNILAWRIPWTEELGGLQSMQRQGQTRLSNVALCNKVNIVCRRANSVIASLKVTFQRRVEHF